MRQSVGTTPDGTIVLTLIFYVLLLETGLFEQLSFPFHSRQVVDVTIMQCFGHAIFDTLGITLA
jgi:hypothetical protein